MSLKAAAAIAASLAICLTGCTTTVQEATPESFEAKVNYFTSYDESHSYAWNIMKLAGHCWPGFERPGISDVYVGDDAYEKLKKSADPAGTHAVAGNLVLTSAMASAGLLSSWTTPGLNFLFLFSSGSVKYKPMFLGFLPKAEAADGNEAIRKYQSNLMNAFAKAAEDLGFTNIVVKNSEITAERPSTHGSISVHLWSGFISHEAYRKIAGNVWQTQVPKWIDEKQGDAWAFGTFVTSNSLTSTYFSVGDEGGSVVSPNKSIELKLQLMDKMTSYLPDNYFVYIPTYKTRAWRRKDEKIIPHCVASNKAKYYFVMPQSAKREPAKQ
ncbi:MAG: hypothetical protein IJ649_01530 [Oscillospiraceae bacterium]|nr:hypothetical protein [Oscillospiraceae bacterium]